MLGQLGQLGQLSPMGHCSSHENDMRRLGVSCYVLIAIQIFLTLLHRLDQRILAIVPEVLALGPEHEEQELARGGLRQQ